MARLMADIKPYKAEATGGAVDERLPPRTRDLLESLPNGEAIAEEAAILLGRFRLFAAARDTQNSPATLRNHLAKMAKDAAALSAKIDEMPESFRAVAKDYAHNAGWKPGLFELEQRMRQDLLRYSTLCKRVADDAKSWARNGKTRNLEHCLLADLADFIEEHTDSGAEYAAAYAAEALRFAGISVPGGLSGDDGHKVARRAVLKARRPN